MRSIASVFLLAVRLLVGGLFLFAAYTKLSDPQSFALSVKAFKLLPNDALITQAAFAIPWAEALCGACLIVGLWTRAAALLLTVMVGGFIYGIWSVIDRGLSVECGCFGDYHWPCGKTIANCHLARNAVLAALCLIPFVLGPGRIALDRPRKRPERDPLD